MVQYEISYCLKNFPFGINGDPVQELEMDRKKKPLLLMKVPLHSSHSRAPPALKSFFFGAKCFLPQGMCLHTFEQQPDAVKPKQIARKLLLNLRAAGPACYEL